jgi:uncharacterized lipoprotein YmbA
MNRRGSSGWVVLALLTGCGSSPNATLYVLSPRGGAVEAAPPRVLEIRRPAVAGYLDRPEIVRHVVDSRVGVAAADRWGEPLDAMIGRVLAEDVEQRCPGVHAFVSDGAVTAAPDLVVELNVRRFDVDDDGSVRLVAEVALERDGEHAPPIVRGVELQGPGGSSTTEGQVRAMSDLLGRLADRIAQLLREPS